MGTRVRRFCYDEWRDPIDQWPRCWTPLPNLDDPRWVPVEQSLPSIDVNVLVRQADGLICEGAYKGVDALKLDEEPAPFWWIAYTLDYARTITHWMPVVYPESRNEVIS